MLVVESILFNEANDLENYKKLKKVTNEKKGNALDEDHLIEHAEPVKTTPEQPLLNKKGKDMPLKIHLKQLKLKLL